MTLNVHKIVMDMKKISNSCSENNLQHVKL